MNRLSSADWLTLAEPWSVRVSAGDIRIGKKRIRIAQTATLSVAPVSLQRVRDEKYDSLPLYNPQAAPWGRGAKLRQLATSETTCPDALRPETLRIKPKAGVADAYQQDKDYGIEARWATFGRLAGGIPENTPVWLDYDCGWHRIDSVIVNRQGVPQLREGVPHNATPLPPPLKEGETRVANLWIPADLKRLTQENLYPILEPAYPEPKRAAASVASRLLPKTWAKLTQGETLKVLAWGDSVTDGGEASNDAHRYQSRFKVLLGERFPKANIQLTTAAWGGRNSDSFLNEPPDSAHNFERAVITPRPDLIVMEFVNDAWMTPDVIEKKYSYLLQRFQEIGAEWIILTPHFVRPDWMASQTMRVEADPRPYVAGVRQFGAKHSVAIADASLRWGHLVKEGVPYITLLSNSINHPNDPGHEMFARALLELF